MYMVLGSSCNHVLNVVLILSLRFQFACELIKVQILKLKLWLFKIVRHDTCCMQFLGISESKPYMAELCYGLNKNF